MSSPDRDKMARELLAAELGPMGFTGNNALVAVHGGLETIPTNIALRAILTALTHPREEPAQDQWRCVNCKHVVLSATEPVRCSVCRHRTFAHIVPSSLNRVSIADETRRFRAFKLAGDRDPQTGRGMWALDVSENGGPERPFARCMGEADARLIADLNSQRDDGE